MRAALEEIRQVASGEKQVAIDDTEGMAWIDKRAQAALASSEGPRVQSTNWRELLQDLVDNYSCSCHAAPCPRCAISVEEAKTALVTTPAPTFEEPLREALDLALQAGQTRYTHSEGEPNPSFPDEWHKPAIPFEVAFTMPQWQVVLRALAKLLAAPPPTASFGGTVGLDGDTRRDWETDGPTFERQAAIYRHALEEIARGGDRALAAEALYNGQSPGAEKLAGEQK